MKTFFLWKFYALKAIGQTLWKAWPLWLLIACAFIPNWFPWFLVEEHEERLTRLGVFYEFMGIVGVAWGIATKMQVGGHYLSKNVLAWLKELRGNIQYLIMGPKKAFANMHATARGNSTVMASVLRGEFTFPEVSLEEKVKILTEAVNGLKKLVTEVEKNAREKIAALEKKVDEQSKAMSEEVKKAHQEFRSALAGDYKLEFAGLFVTLLGMIYNSIPKDIIHIFKWWISL